MKSGTPTGRPIPGTSNMRPVTLVDAADIAGVRVALRAALLNDGPAVLVRDARAVRLSGTGEVDVVEVEDDVAVLVHTSGSSGTPKTVELSSEALRSSAVAAHERLGGIGQWLLALPLSYIAGLSVLIRAEVAGIEPEVMQPGPFDPQLFLETVATMTGERKYTSLVPVQLSRVLDFVDDEPRFAPILHSLDAILVGGQALEQDLAARARVAGANVVTTYGSSETSGGCVYGGIPLTGVEVVIDEATQEIMITGPMLANGYMGNEELTHDKFHIRNGSSWYRTGDAGTYQDGVLSVTGRLDRVIISGGLKVSLDAVEAAVSKLEGYSAVTAVNIPDSEWGVRPGVVVEGIPVDEDAARAEVYDGIVRELGRVAAPKVIVFVSQLPRLTSGKPDLQHCAVIAQAAATSER